MDSEKIGIFIKELRTEKNLTQKELAKKLHVTDRAVSKWERGKGIPDISLLEDLSNILDISIVELLKGEHLDNSDDTLIKDTIIYANKNTKEKMNILFHKICLFLLLIIIINTSYVMIKNYFIKNKKYEITIGELEFEDNTTIRTDTNDYNKIDSIKDKITLVRNNITLYKDQVIVNKCLSFIENDLEDYNWYYSKKYISLQEFYDEKFDNYVKDYSDLYIGSILETDSKYYWELKLREIMYNNIINNDLFDLYESLHNSGLESTDFVKYDIVLGIKYTIDSKYSYYDSILDVLIKVGDINEE